MYLKRLEIVGFKSFADAFELEFQPGISCIVGPNGCGKSNIADAVRWALGTQSPTSLRAERMEDVIFSGTEDRKAQGMAEVILTFDNSRRSLKLDFDEVTVTRRLFRSGDSEYLINGNRCRLMDITDLIVDKGLGSNGYWLLEKNMTETIIESGPAERRFLFDEAAGIVKYKMQRHRAELKLRAVGDDLERLDDIISEVQRNVTALKKQVAAYRRWERAEKKIRETKGLLEHRTLQRAMKELTELERRLKVCRNREQESSAAADAASARQSQARVSLESAQAALDAEHEKCSALDSRMGLVSQELAVNRERKNNLISRTEELKAEIRTEKERAAQLARQAGLKEERIGQLSADSKKATAALEEASASLAAAEEEYRLFHAELDGRKEAFRKVSERVRTLQKEYTDGLRRRERSRQELELALEDMERNDSSLKELNRDRARAEKKLEELKTSIAEIGKRLEDNRESRQSLEEEIAVTQSGLRDMEIQHGLLEARARGLREADIGHGEEESSISSEIEVRDGMELAVGAWLDGFQEASPLEVDDELPSGGNGERYYRRAGEVRRPDLPDGALWLPDCLKEGSREVFGPLLGRGVLAPDRSAAWEWYLGGIELDIVTREGDLFRRDGLVRLGVPETGAGAMERRAMAERSEQEAASIAGGMELTREELKKLSEALAVSRSSREEIRRELSEAERMEASIAATISGYETSMGKLEERQRSLKERIPELKESLDADGSGSTETLEDQREKMDSLSRELEELEVRRQELQSRVNDLLRDENGAKLSASTLKTDLQQAREAKQRFQGDSENAEKRAREHEAEALELEGSMKDLENSIRDMSKKLQKLSSEREEAEEARSAASAERARCLQHSRDADDTLLARREELSSAREERASVEGEFQVVGERCESLRSRQPVLPEEESRYWEYSDEALQKELEKQTGYRENLGPVNMLAVTEYEEGRKRIQFLTEQRDDLNEARESLLGAISEINRTAAKKFDETFVEVREHFKQMFTSLFGGGEADITAMESEDPLEGGVQIMARPPGKKLENITALSSGERAMTAAALLFALYLVKPSPFCVLDELDAPLDDTNVDNYVNLLKGFVERTQFIVITHNKRTMEAADVLYGITMAEKGVSNMTSVSLSRARQLSGG